MEKATRQHTKEHNFRLVVRTIYAHESISRAAIARLTHLSRTTVSDIVSELLEQGLVEETGTGESAGGKPPILLKFCQDAQLVACIDLSSDQFRGALVNLRGRLTHQSSLVSRGDTGNTALQNVYILLDELVSTANSPLAGISVATPGIVDTANGIIRRAVNLDWADQPLRQLLQDRYQVPVFLANDCNLAALAEYMFGEMKQATNLIELKVGRGIGSGIVINGQIHFGDGFAAGEIGHLQVIDNGQPCTCGNRGCLETVASTHAMLQKLRTILKDDQYVSIDTILQDYQEGHQEVCQVVNQAGRYLGLAIAAFVSTINIQNIFISGPIIRLGEPFLQVIRSEVERCALNLACTATSIRYSSLGTEHVLLGAAALVLSQELELF